jgi:hypothetical protein
MLTPPLGSISTTSVAGVLAPLMVPMLCGWLCSSRMGSTALLPLLGPPVVVVLTLSARVSVDAAAVAVPDEVAAAVIVAAATVADEEDEVATPPAPAPPPPSLVASASRLAAAAASSEKRLLRRGCAWDWA